MFSLRNSFSEVFIVHCFLTLIFVCSENVKAFDPDTYLPTNKIIQRHGYPAECHEVTTEDGYILTLHRIPHGKQKTSSETLPPVFFQHGVLGSSADWIISGPEKSLPYLLAEKGHDVWLGNIRGNTYSRGHVSLSPENVAFWNFTFHDMGTKDLVAMIDFVTKTTKQEKLYYVGHSMGTTVFFVLCSMRPEYNDKIITMFALAPVAFMSHAKSPIRYFSPYAKDIELISRWFGDGEFLPRNAVINFILKYGCEITAIEVKLCENNLFIICGHDPEQFNTTLLPVIFGHTPAGTSTKTLAHYAQEIQSGYFREFDYGTEGNQIKYGSEVPPNYNLSNIKTPISLHFADNDLLANPVDVKQLADSLPNLVGMFRVDFHLFNHLDFLWSKDVNLYVNDKILSMIDKINVNDEVPDSLYMPMELTQKSFEDDEPVFNDVSSLLKYEVTKIGKEYLDNVLYFRMATERKLLHLKLKAKKAISKRLRNLKNMFTFSSKYNEPQVVEIDNTNTIDEN